MIRSAAVILALAVSATACSSSTKIAAGTSTDLPTDSVASTDSVGDTTTSAVAESTTSVADTAAPSTDPAPAELVLRENGIGPFLLGDEAGAIADALIEQWGFPATDFTVEYPDMTGLGEYQTAEGDTGFIAPFGRSMCWDFGFCAEFGGGSMTAMSFTGWSYRDDTAATLASESGTTIGTRWADVPSMHVEPGGCYTVGSGTVDGIRLWLTSTGTPFSEFDAGGNYVAHLPEPELTTVTWMETGEIPLFLYGDC